MFWEAAAEILPLLGRIDYPVCTSLQSAFELQAVSAATEVHRLHEQGVLSQQAVL